MTTIRARLSTAFVMVAMTWGIGMGAAPQTEAGPFVTSAAQAGLMEIEAAKVALQVSKNEAVRAFATQMVADHGKTNEELASIARTKGIPVPTGLDPEHAKMVQSLRSRTGKAFDKAYANSMVTDHAKAVELFQANVVHPDGELAAFAGKTLTVLQEHKRLADNLHANLK